MSTNTHKNIVNITERIIERSYKIRLDYLKNVEEMAIASPNESMGCSNIAHIVASMSQGDKRLMVEKKSINLAIVSAYNDMLSAHKPYENYPQLIREVAQKNGITAQVAGMTPAMCDGITQGREGMELSLISRDTIALSTAVALSHSTYQGALMLGICDKIVPGLLIGGLQFGHLPMLFIPAGPMTSGLSNAKKKEIRQKYALKEVSRESLLEAEMQSYHSPGTCTFYGTANSNQMLLEAMGLHRPNHAFVNPYDDMRKLLTIDSIEHFITILKEGKPSEFAIGKIVDEKCIVNAIIALLATGGSTNHTIHWIAVAKAAGIILTWQDIDELSRFIPLICNVYPNGSADVNAFQQAGGPAVVLKLLLDEGLLHSQVMTINGNGMQNQCQNPFVEGQNIAYAKVEKSLDLAVISSIKKPFKKDGGICLVKGNLGEAIVKTSAIKEKEFNIKAPARVFEDQLAVGKAFENNELTKDLVIVVRGQGAKANGMPELHKLMPILSALNSQGYFCALLTDGRLSGASGHSLCAIHLVPEAEEGGLIGLIENGDSIEINVHKGLINLNVSAEELNKRSYRKVQKNQTYGRTLTTKLRTTISPANEGATIW